MLSSLGQLFAPPTASARASAGLLVVRIVVGLALIFHGLPKLASPLAWMGPEAWAPAPLQAVAVFTEVAGGAAIILGFLTPLASLGVFIMMAVAAWTHISMGHPFVGMGGSYEPALAYAAVAFLLFTAGPGRHAIDAFLFRRKG